jgi:glucokinase
MRCAISIDIGGTHIKTALVSQQGKIYKFEKRFTSDLNSKEQILNELCHIIQKKIDEAKFSNHEVLGIAIGSPGIVDPEKKMLIDKAENLSGWDQISFYDELGYLFNYDLYVENDANMAALGEVYFNKQYANHLLSFITIGTGIGSALLNNGNVFYGADFKAGEAGHMTIDMNGPICHCGKRGCWENYVSSRALKERFAKQFNTKLSAKDIFQRLFDKNSSHEEKEFLEYYFYALSAGLYNINQIYNPVYFIIGGGLSDCHPDYITELDKYCQKELGFKSGKVVKSTFGNDAALLGGIPLVLKK